MKRREQSQTEQLRRALADREAQLQEAQARLAALEGSTSLQVGRALTSAAKRPGRGIVRLPRDLFRLWRGAGESRSATAGAAPVRSFDTERPEARLLAGTAGSRDGRLVVAGVLSAHARAALEPYAHVVALRPHDTQVTFDTIDADVVLVSASAAAPGTVWSHVGDPAVADRTRALSWLLAAAAARSIPSVLVADAPAPPALADLGFDHVHNGDLGVPLHRFNPVAAPTERSAAPVLVAGPSPARGPVVALNATLIAAGLERTEPDWWALPDTLRARACVVADTPAIADRALACGARPLLLGNTGDSDRADRPVRTVSAGSGGPGAESALARVRAAGTLAPTEVRAVLRSLFLRDATPVRLAELLGQVSLASGAGDSLLPLRGRAVAVLAFPRDDIDSLAFADDVLNQSHLPAEVVVPRASVRFTGVERLRSHGALVRTVEGVALDPAPDDWARMAAQATTPWTALWHGPHGPNFLADALCAAECSGADAVGPALGGAGAGSEPDYVFVSAIQPHLTRRELLCRGLHHGQWNRHGARLLALAPLRGAESGASHDRPQDTPGTKGTM
ncbi:hypothetical protein [Salinactinospora qingdaonensis]|uniref:hypothetical protein n=1 Tax=Salinactinospora qingdaonensis TaxID=702744 RepID=UPI003CD0B18B